MLRRLYDWTLRLAGHPRAGGALAGVSFAESTVFPIPPDVLLIPMVLAQPERAWRYAGLCSLASVAGALLGYAIGAVLFEAVARPILDFYGYNADVGAFEALYHQYGAWIVAVGGFTPIPFKVVSVVSGAAGLNIAVFTLACLISRAGRFFLIAALVWKYGPPMRSFIERHFGWLSMIFCLFLIGGFLAIAALF